MREITTTVYQFDELTDEKAKSKARDWYRTYQDQAFSDYGHDAVLEDAATICEMVGITLKQNRVPLMNGKSINKPAILYTGFSSQGDGACFEGTYEYKAGSVNAIVEHAPEDKTLHQIAFELAAVQQLYAGLLTATITHTGRYCHNRSVTIEVEYQGDDERDVRADDAEGISEALRDLMQWIYRTLETEYEYQQSDEYVDEQIRANEYEFRADGRRACE